VSWITVRHRHRDQKPVTIYPDGPTSDQTRWLASEERRKTGGGEVYAAGRGLSFLHDPMPA
jgi:hypothetical protein